MIITSDQFIQCCPSAKNVDELVAAMNEILPQCGITEPNQVSAFISQCGHESMDFTRFEENMNYSAANTYSLILFSITFVMVISVFVFNKYKAKSPLE